jgi:hypothetical protein
MRYVLLGVLLSSCTLYENEGGSGSNGPGQGPIGRTFFLGRVIISSTPCPDFFEKESAHDIEVESMSVVRVDGAIAASPVVKAGIAREANGVPPNLSFTTFESWDSGDGFAAPQIRYDVWVDAQFITGKATTSFIFQGSSCDYSFNITTNGS